MIGLGRHIGHDLVSIIGQIDAITYSSPEFVRENIEKLELMFSLNDMEIDLGKYGIDQNPEELLNDETLRQCINELYNSMKTYEKNSFYARLSTDDRWRGIFYDSNPEEMKTHLKIFELIEDDEKYACAGVNLLAGALEFDTIHSDKERLQALISMFKQNPKDNYMRKYLDYIKDGTKAGFNISAEDLANLLEDAHIKEDELVVAGLFGAIDKDEVKNFLLSRPEKYVTAVNALTNDELIEVIEKTNNQEYIAQMILSIHGKEVDSVRPFLQYVEDEYVRAQIILAKSDTYRVNDSKQAMDNIKKYMQIKETFLSLPPEDRVEFLKNIGKDDDQEYEDDERIIALKDQSQIKESLLKHLSHEERMEVIDSMTFLVDDELQPYEKLTREMILEYVTDNFNLTEEQEERLHIALNTHNMFFSSHLRPNVFGVTKHDNRDIEMKRYAMIDQIRLIVDLLHERAHSLSGKDYLISGYISDHTYEEGAADLFAEQVANHYFKKHPEIEIDGERLSPQLPLASRSSYIYENSVVKSMLYPLERSGLDKRALQEFMLGDKNQFFDLCLGEGYSRRFKHDYLGHPMEVSFEEEELLEAHPEEYKKIDRNSLYLIRNEMIDHFSEMAKTISPEKRFRLGMKVQDADLGRDLPSSAQEELEAEKEEEER